MENLLGGSGPHWSEPIKAGPRKDWWWTFGGLVVDRWWTCGAPMLDRWWTVGGPVVDLWWTVGGDESEGEFR